MLITHIRPKIPENLQGPLKRFLFLSYNKDCKGEGGLRKKGYFKHSYRRIDDWWYICDIEGNPVEPVSAEIQIKIKEYINKTIPQKPVINLPLVTVITVVFNGEKHLEQTIESVINQTYPNIEYIIIDGGSTDKTIEIIKKYEEKIDYWLSEKDEGIYDAMNKGISVSTGAWINFMNAGDAFYNNDVVQDVFLNTQYDIDDYDVLYGDMKISYVLYPELNNEIIKAGKLERLWQGMQFCHQSAFCRNRIFRKVVFDKDNISADFEFFYRIYYIEKARFLYLGRVISDYASGGVSERKWYLSTYSNFKSVFKNTTQFYDKIKAILYFSYIFIATLVKYFLKMILPKTIIKPLLRINNRYLR